MPVLSTNILQMASFNPKVVGSIPAGGIANCLMGWSCGAAVVQLEVGLLVLAGTICAHDAIEGNKELSFAGGRERVVVVGLPAIA